MVRRIVSCISVVPSAGSRFRGPQRRTTPLWFAALMIAGIAIPSSSPKGSEPLSFVDRVNAQTAIERVYYEHRIWPKENPQPKPSFEQMVPQAMIEAKVTDYLKKSAALDKFWQRPITAEQLQAEMDRMAKGTKEPAVLHELFASLHDDPYLIAECLARPMLAARLVHNWYACDERFHYHEARAAEEEYARFSTRCCGSEQPSGWERQVFMASDDGPEGASRSLPTDEALVHVIPHRDFLALETSCAEPGCVTKVERETAFLLIKTVFKNQERLELLVRTIPKRLFDDWWLDVQSGIPAPLPDGTGKWALSHVDDSGQCVDRWESSALDRAVDGRISHGAVWTGSEMVMWGGYNGAYLNTGAKYNPATDTWVPTSTINTPGGRNNFTMVWSGTECIVWGGSALNTGGRYNPTTDSWTATGTSVNCPTGRSLHSAIWSGGEMIIWGGLSGTNGVLNTGGRYNPATDSWQPTSIGTDCPDGRTGHTATWTGDEMIVWGGSKNGGSPYYNTGGRYKPLTDSWVATSVSGACPAARTGHTAVWAGSTMVVWGGSNGTVLNSGGIYVPSTDSWTATNTGTTCPAGRAQHCAVSTGDLMIIWGGVSTSYENTGGRFDPATNSWQTISIGTNVPSARTKATAVWSGSEVIIWGGYFGSSPYYLNTGGRYDPFADTWVPTSTVANTPSARWHMCLVWTGAEMFVWGGYNSVTGPYFQDGARYSPATDAWTPVSQTGCPSARMDATAVWTGQEIIVWGGTGSTGSLATGGRYNVAADTWTVTPTGSGCPAARTSHTAVWTGTEMIIWGGGANTGARYNPAAGTWVATSTAAPCPSIRSLHTAIWTGTEMIVWGGMWGGAYLNDGARYRPSPESWSALPTASPCPSARYDHTAVWSGSEMIIWGGYGSTGATNTGGRYSPSSNAWAATSTGQGCPTARYVHAGVWTGGFMIVWGGVGGGIYPSTGGFYAPTTDTWAATPLGSFCPQGRDTAAAVWTGREMIVYGGNAPTVVGGMLVLAPVVTGPSEACMGSSVSISVTPYNSYQWMKDGSDIPGATDSSLEVTESGYYSVRVSYRDGSTCESSSHQVVFHQLSPTVAGPARNACGTMSANLSTQAYSSYQWYKDGSPLTGENGQSLSVSATGSYAVNATDANACSAMSPSWPVVIQDCTDEVSPASATVPVRLVPDTESGTGYYIYFEKIPYATGYSVYQGTLASLAGGVYDHASLVTCDIALWDLGTGELRAEITPGEGDRYLLVIAHTVTVEGPSGYDSLGREIAPEQSICPP